MRASLPAFLRRMAAEPFVWGRFDCSLALADWWLVNHGVDPAPDLRGAYLTAEGSDRIVAGQGGLLRIVSRLARRVGASRTQAPQPGDFGVIRVVDGHGESRHYGAIQTPSGKWAVKNEVGVIVVSNPHIVAAWKI
ncbi:hypothetical protein KHC28_00445 [Ancylobacter sonchi]|uniref:DUF6950 family protein n=1 Tax=Ancylobacter sonchi TaxID=1937790 RepID=UPI001BD54294|nr:hypothetical protein [Ancylobacter sonchi]MBS7532134.1 hypothetical protein [Ancylobacter sonchi]